MWLVRVSVSVVRHGVMSDHLSCRLISFLSVYLYTLVGALLLSLALAAVSCGQVRRTSLEVSKAHSSNFRVPVPLSFVVCLLPLFLPVSSHQSLLQPLLRCRRLHPPDPPEKSCVETRGLSISLSLSLSCVCVCVSSSLSRSRCCVVRSGETHKPGGE